MTIKNTKDVVDRILFLVPDAKCCVWDKSGKYMGEDNPIDYGSFLVDWSAENLSPCPTFAALQAVNDNLLSNNLESKRKSDRNANMKNDLGIVAAFDNARKGNGNLKFSDYLDSLEALQSSIS